MAHINLLPWRETLRKEREIRFFMIMAIALAISAVLFLAGYMYIDILTQYQQSRNDYLQEEIKKADKKIKEIKKLQEERANVEKRIKVIQKLQLSRPESVYLFNSVCSVPDGVFYKNLVQKSYGVTLEGKAQSNARVSSLMNNLDGSEWLKNSKLVLVKETQAGSKNRDFKLEIEQVSAEALEEERKKEELKKK